MAVSAVTKKDEARWACHRDRDQQKHDSQDPHHWAPFG